MFRFFGTLFIVSVAVTPHLGGFKEGIDYKHTLLYA